MFNKLLETDFKLLRPIKALKPKDDFLILYYGDVRTLFCFLYFSFLFTFAHARFEKL